MKVTEADKKQIDAQYHKTKPSLNKVHNIYKKWLHIEDTQFIDIILATHLSQKLKGTPIWMILVGPSGDGKTECIRPLMEDETTTKIIHKFTPNTLVSGRKIYNKTTGEEIQVDLAPKLDNKTMIIPDMAQILQLHPNVKTEIWAQLRDLFDGLAGKQTGNDVDKQYKGLRITMLACSTPAIDHQISVQQSLGSRELMWRTRKTKKTEQLMKKAWMNEGWEKKMREELHEVVSEFMNHTNINEIIINTKTQNKIMKYAMQLCLMRAPAHFDRYKNDLMSDVHPEKPTRVLKQFKRIYVALKSLDNEYTDTDALRAIEHIMQSSAEAARVKVFNTLLESSSAMSLSGVAEYLRLGKSTVQRQLQALHNLGLVKLVEQEDKYDKGWVIDFSHEFFGPVQQKQHMGSGKL